MIRQAVTEAAIEQAAGRARGVNRTAANPVEVLLVLDDTVVPGLDVDGLIGFGDMEPDAIDQMFARGLVPQLPTDAAKLYPDLFPTRAAAKKAYQRDRLGTGRGSRSPRLGTWPYKDISIRRCPQPPRVAFCFQPAGRGQLSRFCIADLVKVPDVRAALEAALGLLVRFEKVGQAKEE
jgi:putative DNA primase/helicase